MKTFGEQKLAPKPQCRYPLSFLDTPPPPNTAPLQHVRSSKPQRLYLNITALERPRKNYTTRIAHSTTNSGSYFHATHPYSSIVKYFKKTSNQQLQDLDPLESFSLGFYGELVNCAKRTSDSIPLNALIHRLLFLRFRVRTMIASLLHVTRIVIFSSCRRLPLVTDKIIA